VLVEDRYLAGGHNEVLGDDLTEVDHGEDPVADP
jgi:hypothetical protein